MSSLFVRFVAKVIRQNEKKQNGDSGQAKEPIDFSCYYMDTPSMTSRLSDDDKHYKRTMAKRADRKYWKTPKSRKK